MVLIEYIFFAANKKSQSTETASLSRADKTHSKRKGIGHCAAEVRNQKSLDTKSAFKTQEEKEGHKGFSCSL